MANENPLVRRIVVTRASGQNEGLRRELNAAFGASVQVIELPCVEFREPQDSTALDSAIRSISSFAWIIFSSQNAARCFADRLRKLCVVLENIDAMQLHPRIAAIGPATAEVASASGFSVDFVPSARSGAEFAESFIASVRGVAGMRILVPRSDLGLRDVVDWTETLQGAGAEVTCVETYQTRAPENLKERSAEILRSGADCFVFSSPSAFQHFAHAAGIDNVKRLARESIFAAIGSTTATAIREAGVACVIESSEPDVKLMTEAIASYLKSVSHRSSAQVAPKQGANWA